MSRETWGFDPLMNKVNEVIRQRDELLGRVATLEAALATLLDALEPIDPGVLGIGACAAYDYASHVLESGAALSGGVGASEKGPDDGD